MRVPLRQLSVALIVLSLLSVSLLGASRADENKGEDTKNAEAELPILNLSGTPSFRAGQYLLVIDAGTLNVDTKYRVHVAIENPYTETMVLRGVDTSCSCIDAKVSSLVINQGDEVFVEFTAPVAEKMKRPDAQWRVRLAPKAKPDFNGISVVVRYNVAGLMGFLDKRIVLETTRRNSVNEFELPMILTKPVQAKNILVHIPESLSSVKAEVLSNDQKHFLRVQVSGDALKAKYAAGEIECMDELTGIEDKVYCVFRKSDGVSVYPAVLRSVNRNDENEGSVISAIIRIDTATPSLSKNGNDKQDSEERTPLPNIVVDAKLNNHPLKIKTTRISRSALRVKVNLSKDEVALMRTLKKPRIQWGVRTTEGAFKLNSVVSLSK